MAPTNRRSFLKLGWIALGTGLTGCLGDGEPNSTDSPTDTPSPSKTAEIDCQGTATDDSWDMEGAWQADITVSNDDDRSYRVSVELIHHGSEPCHHAETSPCQMPEKRVTAFDRTIALESDKSVTFPDITLELWETWIDDYTVEIRIEDEDTASQDRVFAYETGARADWY